jgi:hypothetical protein
MDSSFRIMPLKGEGDECIASAEDWPNTKDGIDKLYRHWNRTNNISGEMKIVTKLSLAKLKLHKYGNIPSLPATQGCTPELCTEWCIQYCYSGMGGWSKPIV